MNRVLSVIATVYMWVLVITTNPPLGTITLIIGLITIPFDKKMRVFNYCCRKWSSLYIRGNPFWRIVKEGLQNADKKKTYVVVANHQSALDIILLWNTGIPHKWISKTEVFKTPFIGWQMRLHGDIELKRNNPKSIARMFDDCAKKIKKGDSIIIFPEGTRSSNMELKSFKTGAFHLALITKTPILPIVHFGTGAAFPKDGVMMRWKNTFKLRVLPEIPYESFAHMDEAQLTEHVHSIMKREYDLLKKEFIQ